MNGQDKASFSGTIEKITYRNESNAYTVLTLSNGSEEITAVGIMPFVSEGECCLLQYGNKTRFISLNKPYTNFFLSYPNTIWNIFSKRAYGRIYRCWFNTSCNMFDSNEY